MDKWIKNLYKIRHYKTFRRNHRPFFDINHSKIFYDPPPRIMKIKTKNKWDLIKLKSFCTAKETINKAKKTTLRKGEKLSK